MSEVEEMTAANHRVSVVAANYGGQWDILQAAQHLATEAQAGRLNPAEITPALFQSYLATGDMPLPDLCIRTGGERRISNFLLWQLAYAELYFSDLYWPDFKHVAMRKALADFATRQRRFVRRVSRSKARSRPNAEAANHHRSHSAAHCDHWFPPARGLPSRSSLVWL